MALFLATCTQIFINYKFIEPGILANKIYEFINILDLELTEIENKINNDPIFCYLYLTWNFVINSDYKAIKKFFSTKSYQNISLQSIPKIKCIHNISSLKLRFMGEINNNNNSNNSSNSDDNILTLVSIPILYNKELILNDKTAVKLGDGAYGTVYKIKMTDKEMALKKIPNKDEENGIYYVMIREINSMMMLDHQNIVKLYGFIYDPQNTMFYIGLELMDMTLYDAIINNKISEKTKESFIMQLLKGLEYMHNKNIMHRDISVTNILVTNNGILKISDFGSSRYFRHPQYIVKYSSHVCTIYYRPIELLLGKMPYTYKIDVWSCACVIGIILQDSQLFDGIEENGIIRDIFRILGTPTNNYCSQVCLWPNFPSNIPTYPRREFMELNKKYPKQMPILYKMLEYYPDKRIDISEALKLFLGSYGSE